MNPIIFDPSIAHQKPSNQDSCPFCKVDELSNIFDQQDDLIWLENKYQTLEDTYLTLIIESSEHLGDISNYSQTYNRKLLHFAVDKFQQMKANNKYQSVAMFRNFGPLSGGSLRHPHLQIVGFKRHDIYAQVDKTNFEGLIVEKRPDFELNLSTKPIMGFSEFNLILSDWTKIDLFADKLRKVTQYLLHKFHNGNCNSYNIFFYDLDDKLICKVVPRFIASPYYVGYIQSQRSSTQRLEQIRDEFLQGKY